MKNIKDPKILMTKGMKRRKTRVQTKDSHRVPFLFHLLIFVCFAPQFHLLPVFNVVHHRCAGPRKRLYVSRQWQHFFRIYLQKREKSKNLKQWKFAPTQVSQEFEAKFEKENPLKFETHKTRQTRRW